MGRYYLPFVDVFIFLFSLEFWLGLFGDAAICVGVVWAREERAL